MTVLDLFSIAADKPADQIRGLIIAGGNAAPDLKPLADALLAALNEPLSAANLSSVAAALPGELKDVLAGHLNPRDHASDAG